jgi:hypothetical protein
VLQALHLSEDLNQQLDQANTRILRAGPGPARCAPSVSVGGASCAQHSAMWRAANATNATSTEERRRWGWLEYLSTEFADSNTLLCANTLYDLAGRPTSERHPAPVCHTLEDRGWGALAEG